MKKKDLSERLRGNVPYPNINIEKLSPEIPSTSQGSRTTKDIPQNWQNRSNATPKLQITNSPVLSEPKSKEPKHKSELGAMALTLSYCLNTQSKMASLIEEIGLYLNDLGHENQNTSQKQIYFAYSPSNNLSSNASKDRLAKKVSIQLILAGVDGLKKEITSKILDFEQCISDFDSDNQVQSKNIILALDEGSNNVCPKPSPTSQHNSMRKKVAESPSALKTEPQQFQTIDRFKGLPHEVNKLCIDSLNEGILLKNASLETPTIKQSPFIQSNLPTPQAKTKDGTICEKKEIVFTSRPKLTNKSEIINHQNIINDEKPPTSTDVENSTNDSMNKQSKPSKLKDIVSTTNPLAENILSQTNIKQLQKQSRPVSISQTDQKVTVDSNTNEQAKTVGKMSIPIRRRMTSVGSLPNNLVFPNAKLKSREVNLEAGHRKNSIKPPQSIIPQKQIADDSLRGNTIIDQTIQLERSVLNTDRTHNMSVNDKSQNPDTQRAHATTEVDEIYQYQTQLFMKNTANKEKSIIKSLMKEQYGEENRSYHTADHGKIHQRKCLINAKWWRAWKDFVNFDADEDNEKKSSFFEAGLYPRPGPINNKELLRSEAILDLANLSSELELKENLLEHHDYEAVNKKVYDVLAKWYGSDFEISRVLKPDPFRDNKPYLDLYPKKRSLGKTSQKSVDARMDSNYTEMIRSIIKSNLNALSPS